MVGKVKTDISTDAGTGTGIGTDISLYLAHHAWSRCAYLHKRTFSFLPVFFPGYFSTSCVASLRLLLLAAGVLAAKE